MKANYLFNVFVVASVLLHTLSLATSEHHQISEHTHDEVELESVEKGHTSSKKSDDPDCLGKNFLSRARVFD